NFHNPSIESATCLFLALSVKRGRVQLDQANITEFLTDYFDVIPEDLGDPNAIPPIPPKPAQANSPVVKVLIDSWGNPLQFQRWFNPNLLQARELAAMNPR